MKNPELTLKDAKTKIIKIWSNSLDCLSHAERNQHILYRDLFQILNKHIFDGLEPNNTETYELNKGKLVVCQADRSMTYRCQDGNIVLSYDLFSKMTNRIHFLCTFDELNQAVKMFGPLDEFIADFESLKVMAESYINGYPVNFAIDAEQYINEEDLFKVKQHFMKLQYMYVQDIKAFKNYLIQENQNGELADILIKRSQVLAYNIKKFDYLNLIDYIVDAIDFKERIKVTYEEKEDFICFNFYPHENQSFDVENNLSHENVKVNYLVDYFIEYDRKVQFSTQDLIYYYQLEYFYTKFYDIARELMRNVSDPKKYEELSYHPGWSHYFEYAEHVIKLKV